jgi:hypothetical protein
MGGFAILTNRRRTLVALVHSIVFLLIAAWQMIGAPAARAIWASATVPAGTWVLCGIYGVASAILLWLFTISRGWMEKIYFALCAVSAASGLLRTIVGDHGFHSGRYIRVVMLTSAVAVGLVITRVHSELVARSS